VREAQPKPRPPVGVVDVDVFNPLPIGARDLLPATAKRRRAVQAALLSGFEAWGYREVTPPLIEYFEVLGRGLGSDERERCVRFIEAGTGELVALRSDVTPQIARMVAQRVGGSVEPGDGLRLSYAATLVRLPHGRHDRAELHQVGVEYVGDPSPHADAELIGLADHVLTSLGSSGHRFDLSHTALVRGALAALAVDARVERALREALARKDTSGIRAVLHGAGLAADLVAGFVALAELQGPPSLLGQARERLAPLGLEHELRHLEAVVDALALEHPGAHARLILDLGESRGFDYYTGLRVRVWAPGSSGPIVRGGRYDDLLSRYGAELPATGLAFDLDGLEDALAFANIEVPGSELGAARMVAIAPLDRATSSPGFEAGQGSRMSELRAAAVAETRAARAAGLRAWIDDELELEQAQRLAERRGADRLTWFEIADDDESTRVVGQRFRRVADRWQPDASSTEQEQA
jgi:ATP phosphoribosyltransferase regulatory subunit